MGHALHTAAPLSHKGFCHQRIAARSAVENLRPAVPLNWFKVFNLGTPWQVLASFRMFRAEPFTIPGRKRPQSLPQNAGQEFQT